MHDITMAQMYKDIGEWKEGRADVIIDDTAYAIIGEFEIDGTIADADALRDEIITMARELEYPSELSALLAWLNFYSYCTPVNV